MASKCAEMEAGEASTPSVSPCPDQILSDELKAVGNDYLKSGRFKDAIVSYTEALAAKETAVLYSNRSLAHAKVESYGLAITDADMAIEIDPS
jgi:serine/threonine-protein phosphatase 5